MGPFDTAGWNPVASTGLEALENIILGGYRMKVLCSVQDTLDKKLN